VVTLDPIEWRRRTRIIKLIRPKKPAPIQTIRARADNTTNCALQVHGISFGHRAPLHPASAIVMKGPREMSAARCGLASRTAEIASHKSIGQVVAEKIAVHSPITWLPIDSACGRYGNA